MTGSGGLKGKLSKYIMGVRNESERRMESELLLKFSQSVVFMGVISEGNNILKVRKRE